ncbi:APC family permease [Pseudonocardia sp. TRM90224]|uniref:APC family permease n=1 Tax=Pseudonocardia sp. TRM90224 TaxID=2812678 RepID=UPI001E39C5F2|nr:APC family permease [Pseudonocardia sp. TRM90224]
MSSPGQESPPQQLPRRVSTLGGLALAVSNVGPTISIGVGLGIIASVAGPQMPIVFVLAFLPMLGIAVSYMYLNREEPNCGTAYVWLRTAFSPWIGYLTGWVVVCGGVMFLAYGAPLAGRVTLAMLQSIGVSAIGPLAVDPDSNAACTIIGLLWLLLVTALAVRGTDLAVRTQLVLVVFEIIIVGGLGVVAFVAGDASPVQASWFDPAQLPPGQALATSLVLAVFVFWGWDSSFSVTEETRHPAQSSRAGFATLFLVLGLFIFAALAFQRALTPQELVEQGPLGLPYLGQKLLGVPGEVLATAALLLSTVAVLQSVVIASSRMTLAMGRDRTLGQLWTRLHPRYGTPAGGTIAVAVISAVLSVLALALGPLQTVITGLVTAIGLLVSLQYGFAGLAAAWRFRGWLTTAPARALLAVVLPALSAVFLLALGGYLFWLQATSTDHFAFDATNGWFLNAVPLGVLVLGLLLAAYTRFVRKAPYFSPRSAAPAVATPSPLVIQEAER